jgi:hypothetical protein
MFQVAIPQEILNIVYIRYMFRHYLDLTNYQNCQHLYLQWLTVSLYLLFSADLPVKK